MTPDKIAQTLIDIGVEIDTHQDGDAFIKTFTFNEAQLDALLTQHHQDMMSDLLKEFDYYGNDHEHILVTDVVKIIIKSK